MLSQEVSAELISVAWVIYSKKENLTISARNDPSAVTDRRDVARRSTNTAGSRGRDR